MDKCDEYDFAVPQNQRETVKDRYKGMVRDRIVTAHMWLAEHIKGIEEAPPPTDEFLYNTARVLLSYDLDVGLTMSLMSDRLRDWDGDALLSIIKRADNVGTSKRHTFTDLNDLYLKIVRQDRIDAEKVKGKPTWAQGAHAVVDAEAGKMKPTNPKDAVGIRKPRFYSGMSAHVRRLVSIGMMEGAMKYGRHNYRPAAVRASVYYDATNEHMDCWWEGEDIDPDSGLPHVIKAICSLYVLADAIITGNLVDDRPPRTVNPREIVNKYQPLIDKLFERYPEPKEAYTHLNSSVDSLVKTAEEK